MNVHEAVKSLRTSLDDSQQAFAVRLGMSIRAIASFEKTRTPSLGTLHRLRKLATDTGHHQEANVFRAATIQHVGQDLTGKLAGISVDVLSVLGHLNAVTSDAGFVKRTHPAALEALVIAQQTALKVYEQLKAVTPEFAETDVDQ